MKTPQLAIQSRPKRSRPTLRLHAGFTLLELLVAMAVLSILVVMMMGLVDSAAKLWRDSENRVDAYREARAAMGVISRDLKNALATTNTNHFLVNDQGAFNLIPSSAEKDTNRAGALFFLSALPSNAQEPGKNKSDLCEVGYFLGFERLGGADRATLNLYRFFRSSDPTFSNLVASNSFTGAALTGPESELLARNIREFQVIPYVQTNTSFLPFTPTPAKPVPDLIEIRITAVNQEASRRFLMKSDWTSASPPTALTNAQQTFVTRIHLNTP